MSKNIAIIGATGLVGQELLKLLEERNFPINNLKLLASPRSVGKLLKFKGESIPIEKLEYNSFSRIDIVFASAGGSLSKEFAPSAVRSGAIFIDNTSHFRMVKGVPLIIPEINAEEIKKHKGIIANPNCSTIIMLIPLALFYKKFGIKRIFAATYQAVSGAGAKAMRELEEETKAYLEGNNYNNTVIGQPYAFNLFPHNSNMNDNGYVQEEMKMINETKKIFSNQSIEINAFCVRVPVMRAHSEVLNVEFSQKISVNTAYKILSNTKGVEIFEDRSNNKWATPLNVSGKNSIYVGRIRQDLSRKNCLDFWVVGDQIRKGAALNAIQIAELL